MEVTVVVGVTVVEWGRQWWYGGDSSGGVTVVIRWSEGDDGNRFITEDSFVAAMDELQSDSAAWRILQLKRMELQQWLQALGLIWPSDENRNEYSVCPITSRLIDSL